MTKKCGSNRIFGTEFEFLQLYGLSIMKEDDREEGRAIARTMMNNDPDRRVVQLELIASRRS